MLPSDLGSFRTLSQPAISPDGTRVLFTVSRMNLEEDRYDRAIWLWEEGEDAHRFTAGPGDSAPEWSPDGSRAAFVRTVEDVAQAAVISLDGGEATVVTSSSKGVRKVAWMPDGERLMVHSVEWSEEWAELDDEERSRRPRRVTSIPYRFDTLGWIHAEHHHIAIVNPESGTSTTLVDAPGPVTSPVISPDGEHIGFLADLGGEPVSDLRSAVYRTEVDSGEITEVAPLGMWSALTVGPDGTLFATGFPEPHTWPRSSTLWRRDDDWVELSPGLDRNVVLAFGAPITPVAVEGGVISAVEDAGRVGLAHTALDGAVTRLVDDDRALTGFSPTSDGRRVAFTSSTTGHPGELHMWDAEGVRRLTDLNVDASVSFIEGDHFTVEGDGGTIDAWVYLPPGDDDVPLLLNVHGGPASQYGFGFFDEFQVYAAAGYGVVAANPRGSSGRGTPWLRAVVGDGWGTNDLADIRAVVTAALERSPRLDADRLGVMGGSYGGFMAGWIIGNEDRWRSAVVERALLSFPSFAGTSDIGHTFPEHYIEVEMPDGADRLWEKSPQSLAHKVTTPTLLLHSENDYRCPIEQAEQFFTQLLRNGTPAEMLRFPGESHELSRSGKPRHRQERFEAILEWHARWL